MPDYAKFMKDMVTKKRSVSFEDDERMQHCCSIATRSLVQNKEDSGTFTMPCNIGFLHFAEALFTKSWVWVTQSPLRCGY